MIEQQAPASAWRAPWWLVAVLLVVAVGVGLGAGALVWAGDSDEPAQESQGGDGPTNPNDMCLNVYFSGADPDSAMLVAADKLQADPRFETVLAVTQEQAFAEFKEIFADQPELLELARKESMPAAVRVKVRESGTENEVKAQLTEEFPEADDVAESACQR